MKVYSIRNRFAVQLVMLHISWEYSHSKLRINLNNLNTIKVLLEGTRSSYDVHLAPFGF